MQVHGISVTSRLPQRVPHGAQLAAARLRVGLQPAQRLHQHLFDLGEVAAQRVIGQGAIVAERRQRRRQCLWCIALLPLRIGLCRCCQLARGEGLLQQRALEWRLGDCRHRVHAVVVGQAAHIGDAVLVEIDVTQVARNGRVTVVPAHIGFALATIITRGAEHQHTACFRQRMRHRHEVVLAAHTGDYASIFQCIGHRCAQCGSHHAGIEKARVSALQAFQCFVAAVQLVDLADAAHADRPAFVLGQGAQPFVEFG
ncbi:hypothetical protein D3C75_584180 [compost metagenome]